MGGADDDTITAPTGGKIILGDNGQANFAGPDRNVFSTDPDIGGIDLIVGGADGVGNILIGGAQGDRISGGSGDDVIMGDLNDSWFLSALAGTPLSCAVVHDRFLNCCCSGG